MKPPPSEFSLGLSQQCWHMAHAACDSLSLEFSETSPNDIELRIRCIVSCSRRLLDVLHITRPTGSRTPELLLERARLIEELRQMIGGG